MDTLEESNEPAPSPMLRASWSSACEMESVDIEIAADGDPAGVLPGGSGRSGFADFAAPGHPEVEYTAAWRGTTPLTACTLTEAPNGGGE